MNKSFQHVIREDFLASQSKFGPSDYLDEDKSDYAGPYQVILYGGYQQRRQAKVRACDIGRAQSPVIDYALLGPAFQLKCSNDLVESAWPASPLPRKREVLFSSSFEEMLANLASQYAAASHHQHQDVLGDWVGRSTLRNILQAQTYDDVSAASGELTRTLAQEVEARFVACIADRGYQAQHAGQAVVRLVSFSSDHEVRELDDSFLLTSANDFGLSLFKAPAVIGQLVRDYWVNSHGDALRGEWGELHRQEDSIELIPADKTLLQGFASWE